MDVEKAEGVIQACDELIEELREEEMAEVAVKSKQEEKDRIRTCDICSYQSTHQEDFCLSITGSLECMRCHCSWHPSYIEPDWFTQRYGGWREFRDAE